MFTVFPEIVTQLPQGLELAVPGTYMAGQPVVTIAAFAPQLTVITSKQRPRKLTIHGSDGAEYMFLLKARLLLLRVSRGSASGTMNCRKEMGIKDEVHCLIVQMHADHMSSGMLEWLEVYDCSV